MVVRLQLSINALLCILKRYFDDDFLCLAGSKLEAIVEQEAPINQLDSLIHGFGIRVDLKLLQLWNSAIKTYPASRAF